ncbi:TetR family transcriptional regulator [Caldovatus aquaticus]|uniref:TetR family transcriptional regulator n=1 Tax=Caldovatus aquaticus TaxID=2865671 RepID=A0ABS7F476_9PROT|nr:TetR family transcriptional regulator [Caldovatus aquaticus]MBW8269590.1 TetR family transcriptional regulator [Caldovatus aquaticus]
MSATASSTGLPHDAEARLHAAFWRAVAAQGWHGLTMRRLAAESGLPLADLRAALPTPLHALRLHLRLTDREVLRGTLAGQGGSARDRLFDVLMRRFDALQPHRPGVLRLLHDLGRDPLLALALAPGLVVSMAWMLEAAEIGAAGAAGLVRAQGLAGLWLAALRAWERDPSEDLGRTMAALDRLLDRAEWLARRLDLGAEGPEEAGAG